MGGGKIPRLGQESPAGVSCPPGVKILRVGDEIPLGIFTSRGQAAQGGGQDKHRNIIMPPNFENFHFLLVAFTLILMIPICLSGT